MGKECVISVNNVSKSFKSYKDKKRTIKDLLSSTNFKNESEKRKVLSDISFSIYKGEAVGLIGKNGCGKSTTLKLLTKILKPDSGTIEVKGRVASLIELGAGFHPDMTGRENVYINASIFGISKKEVDRKMEDIISFSELQDFIDEPVRTYSSGMYMRLAFSVAVNVKPDVLLIDEILAVGDARFQEKCLKWIEKIKSTGVTIVIVSHSQNQIERICDRVIWIDNGQIRAEGYVHEIYNDYLYDLNELDKKEYLIPNSTITECEEMKRVDYDILGTGKLKCIKIINRDSNRLHMGEDLDISLEYDVFEDITDIVLQIIIRKTDGRPVISGMMNMNGSGKGSYTENININSGILAPDEYRLQFVLIEVASNGTLKKMDALENLLSIQVYRRERWDLETWGNVELRMMHCEDK